MEWKESKNWKNPKLTESQARISRLQTQIRSRSSRSIASSTPKPHKTPDLIDAVGSTLSTIGFFIRAEHNQKVKDRINQTVDRLGKEIKQPVRALFDPNGKLIGMQKNNAFNKAPVDPTGKKIQYRDVYPGGESEKEFTDRMTRDSWNERETLDPDASRDSNWEGNNGEVYS